MMVDVGDQLVELTDDEMAQATAGAAVDKGYVEIETFVPLEAIGTTYLVDTERLYQVRSAPKEVKRTKVPDKPAEKLYRVLLAAMASRQAAALLRISLRGTARYAVLTPDAEMKFLFYPEEIREQLPLSEAEYTNAELAGFGAFIDAIGYDTPDLVDDAKAAINAFLALKIAGEIPEIEALPEPDAVVLDLSAALEASIAAVKNKAA